MAGWCCLLYSPSPRCRGGCGLGGREEGGGKGASWANTHERVAFLNLT